MEASTFRNIHGDPPERNITCDEFLELFPETVALQRLRLVISNKTLCMTDNQRRWLILGIILNKGWIKIIRPFVEQEIQREYRNLQTSHHIHTQSSIGRLQRHPKALKYENINGNDTLPRTSSGKYDYFTFDCRVKSHIDFAKLYVEKYAAKFNAFDEHCDASALLELLIGVPVFPPVVRAAARNVRQLRNSWAHDEFDKCDQMGFQQSLDKLKQLVKELFSAIADKDALLTELDDWEKKAYHEGIDARLYGLEQPKKRLAKIEESTVFLTELCDWEKEGIDSRLYGLEQPERRLAKFEESIVLPRELSDWEKEVLYAVRIPMHDYIKVRGPVALEAYRRALETGKTFDRRTKIVLIGQDRVGKTSLRRYLRGEAFVKDEASTNGIEMISPVKNAGKGAWRNPALLEKTSALDHKCAELVTQELRSSSEERLQRIQGFAGKVKETRGEPTGEKGVTQERSNDDLASKEVIERKGFLSRGNDLDTEWLIVMGISGLADGAEERENRRKFAEIAASVIVKILSSCSIFEDWPHCKVDTDPIPNYIKARGPVALEAYRRALETGETFDRRTKIALIGQDRVGKTSLRRYLRGEAFDKDEASTNGIEMISPVKNAGKGAWRNPAPLEKTSALDHKCAELVTQELRSSSEERPQRVQLFAEEVKKTKGEPTREKRVTQERSNDDLASKEVTERKVFQEVESEQKPEEVPENVRYLLDYRFKAKDTSDNEDIWPFIWDFAGQAVYHAIHPVFLSQEAIYVLVSDLTKELSDVALCRIRPANHDEIEVDSPYVQDTNLDHMMRWLDLVQSLRQPEFQGKSADTNQVLPPVVLVGTHADGIRDPCKEMESVNETICSMAHSETLKHISKELFFIDNTNPNREDDPQIVSLRTELLNLARKMPNFNKVIPMQWLRVEQKVDDMVKQGMHYVGKKRFAEDISGGICQFNHKDDVEELLHFLQARGRVIYQDLPDNPDGLVVLDPQWLIKILCEIITVSPPWKNDPVLQKDYKVLGREGLLSQQLLNQAFEHLELSDVKDSLIHIMESFDVICNSKNCKGKDYPYFVPCMLKSPKKNTRGTNMHNGPLPVFLTFNTNYVPSGLFCRLVVHFWKEWASQLCRDPRMAPSLFSNAARFNVSEVYHLTLECHKTVIKLIIWTQRDSDGMEEKRICEELLNHLEDCGTKLSVTCPWLRSSTMELYVKCQLCEPCPDKCRDGTNICILHKEKGCSHFDCGHYIPLGSSGLSCEHSVDAVPDYPREKLDPWVQALKSIERKKRTGGSTKHLEESSPCDASAPKKGKTRVAVEQGVPSDEDLEWLSHQLENWEAVGRRLKIKKGRLTAFDNDNKDSFGKIYNMLLHWKERDGSAATYTVLHDALCHEFVNRKDLAEKLCRQKHE